MDPKLCAFADSFFGTRDEHRLTSCRNCYKAGCNVRQSATEKEPHERMEETLCLFLTGLDCWMKNNFHHHVCANHMKQHVSDNNFRTNSLHSYEKLNRSKFHSGCMCLRALFLIFSWCDFLYSSGVCVGSFFGFLRVRRFCSPIVF